MRSILYGAHFAFMGYIKYRINFHKAICAALICSAFAIFSCKEKEISAPFISTLSNNANGFVISGDNYVSSLFLMNLADSNNGYYDTTMQRNRTFVNAVGDSIKSHINVQLNFLGSPGYANARDTSLTKHDIVNIKLFDKTSQVSFNYASVPGKTLLFITKYDYYNGRISGSFRGPFVNLSQLSDTVKITDGRFSVLRLPDKY
jgi:hypothetical protein